MFSILRKLPAALRKLLPTIILMTIGILAGATDVFSAHVHRLVSTTLNERAKALMPMAVNFLIIAILFNIAYLLYGPAVATAERVLRQSGASDRGKTFALRAAKLLYWLLTTFTIVSIFAPELMGKLFLSFSVLGAAITLALQESAKNFICGLLMQFTRRVQPGENLKAMGGSDVEGKIVDIGYLFTVVEGENGTMTVPNTHIWDRSLLQKKEQSKILLPPGVDRQDNE